MYKLSICIHSSAYNLVRHDVNRHNYIAVITVS